MSNRLLDMVHVNKDLNEQIMMVRINFWVEEHLTIHPDVTLEYEDIISFAMAYTNDEDLSIHYADAFEDYYLAQFNICANCNKLCVDEDICKCVNTGKCTGICKHE